MHGTPSSNPGLDGIEHRVRQLAAGLVGAVEFLPSFGTSRQDGMPHVEVSDAYFFVVCERGSELERRRTEDFNELLFWIFSSVTFSLAVRWEVSHRRDGEDPRRQMFAKQIELLEILSPPWAAREAQDHRRILLRHPFNDA